MSVQARDALLLANSLLAVVRSSCLYVLAVLYRARAASRSFALSVLAFGAFAAMMLVRLAS